MNFDGHLSQTFYLSRPQNQTRSPKNSQQLSQKRYQKLPQTNEPNRGSQMKDKDEKSQNKSNCKLKRLLKMINNKILPSTAINTPTSFNKVREIKTVPSQKFLTQFGQFFKGFIEKQCTSVKKDQESREKKERKQVKKVVNRTKSLETVRGQSSQEDEESFFQELREKNKKMTYHQRIKLQIDHHMDSILARNQQKKYKVKFGHNYTKSNLEQGIWLKTIEKQQDPKLRITKTGLTFHSSEIDQKYVQKQSTMLQRQKAKKDRLFQKTLAQNNLITLNSIQNYHYKAKVKKEHTKLIPQKKVVLSRCQKDTHCTQNRKKTLIEKMRRSCDDLDHLKLRRRCLQIQWNCDQSNSIHKQISKGLKAFQSLNNAVATNLNFQANALAKIMADDMLSNSKNKILYFQDYSEQ